MNRLEAFIHHESAGGILLMIATVLALLLSNTMMAPLYETFRHIPVQIRVGPLNLDKSLYHWVNDGLMAIFFLLVGLEVKREVLEGHLSSLSQVMLPAVAAVGGMAVPAGVYLFFNREGIGLDGWAIPTATDIAFALGILSLLGKRVPVSLKVFLMTLAIFDDLGAIVIIALFYTNDLSTLSLTVAAASLAVLVAMNLAGVSRKLAYFLVGAVLWVSVLKSGVHATLAGVALAFTIPMKGRNDRGEPTQPLQEIEHDLHPWVAFAILPLFAFVNAGVDMRAISLEQMTSGVPVGILLGLFLGKQIGVFGFSWVVIRTGLARMPEGGTWLQLYGVSLLTGIGFTMSLFIASLAFPDEQLFQYTDKLAILSGSVLAGVTGYLVLRWSRPAEA